MKVGEIYQTPNKTLFRIHEITHDDVTVEIVSTPVKNYEGYLKYKLSDWIGMDRAFKLVAPKYSKMVQQLYG